MRRFLILLGVFFVAKTAAAQTSYDPNKLDPALIWQEYLNTTPATEDIARLVSTDSATRAIPPYTDFAIKELLTRDLSGVFRGSLIHLLNLDSPELSEKVWYTLGDDLSLKDLQDILVAGNNANKNKVLTILENRSLTCVELIEFMPEIAAGYEKEYEPYFKIILDRFLRQQPTNDDLFRLSREGFYQEIATRELLKRPLTPNELYEIATKGSWLRATDKDQIEAWSRLNLADLDDERLAHIVNVELNLRSSGLLITMEPYASMAKEILECRNYDNIKKRRAELVGAITGKK